MLQIKYYSLLVLLGMLGYANSQSVDETLVPLAKGADVAEAVVRKIQRSGVFPHDQNLLRRLAFVESRDGEDTKTFRPNYFGGIWQLDQDLFNQTQNVAGLATIYQNIKTTWHIEWNNVTWNDLVTPFHSGLGARLFLHKIAVIDNAAIPGTINAQATYWMTRYNRGNQTVVYFQEEVARLESDGGTCEGLMDICIVLDGSASIGAGPFVQAKGFVADLVATFSLSSTRVALSLYSDIAEKIFDFNNNLTETEMGNTIRNARYPNANTNTPAGLHMAVDFFNQATPRPGMPKVVATFTDGVHNRGNLPNATLTVARANLTSFAVGIGTESQIDDDELRQIALENPANVFRVNDYAALAEFFYQMNKVTCEVPQEPELGIEQTGTLARNEKRYFKYQIPVQGITLSLSGQVSGYYSNTEPTPNSALHDGDLSSSKFITHQPNNSFIYIGIRGNSNATVGYILLTEEGNQATTPLASTLPPMSTVSTPASTSIPSSTSTILPTSTIPPSTTTTNSGQSHFINPLACLAVAIYSLYSL